MRPASRLIRAFSLLSAIALLGCFGFVTTASASPNDGARAWLTWSATGIVSDLANPGPLNTLSIRVEGAASFKGAEFDLTWNPPGDGVACAALIDSSFPTSADCSALNRGLVIPIVTASVQGHYHVAWANTLTNTACAAGGQIFTMTFAFDGCADPRGCFSLNCLQLIDGDNIATAVDLPGRVATVLGGSGLCPVNTSPVFDALPPLTAHEGTALAFVIHVTDVDGNCLTSSATGLPLGATFVGGAFAWTPALGQAGTYPVLITVTDGAGGTAAQTCMLTVTPDGAPSIDPVANRSVAAGALLSFSLAGADPDGDPLTFGASPLPTGASVAGTTFSWVPTVAQVGTYGITFTATDPAGLTASTDAVIEVRTNAPPIFPATPDQTVGETHALTFAVHATDPDGGIVTYDATGLPPGATFNGTFAWTPSLGQAGLYSVIFTARDPQGLSTADSIVITVTPRPNQPPVLAELGAYSVIAGSTLSVIVSATDADNDPITYTAAPMPIGATFYTSTQTFTWKPATDQVGSYELTFTATDILAVSDTEVVAITVLQNLPPVWTPTPDKTVAETYPLTFVVSATDPEGGAVTYGMAGAPSGATFSGATFAWLPAVGQAGGYSVVFTATDIVGGVSRDTVGITVTVPANHAPSIAALGAYAVSTASALAFTVSATDADSDPITLTGAPLPSGATFSGGQFAWTPTTAQAGYYVVTFTASDPFGASDTEAVAIVVDSTNHPSAYLSWSATTNVTDKVGGWTSANLYVRFQDLHSFFRGGEIDLTWDPASDFNGCFDHIGTSYKTSSGTTCTYLNRGTAVAVTTADDAYHFHVAWSTPSSSPANCTAGVGIIIQFENDTCPTQAGCFNLNSAVIYTSSGGQELVNVAGPVATINGGVSHCQASSPVDPGSRQDPRPLPPGVQLSVGPGVARSRTTARFTLPVATHARLAMYDARGSFVAQIVDDELPAGTYTREWDMRDARGARVPAGVYAMRLVALGESHAVRVLAIP